MAKPTMTLAVLIIRGHHDSEILHVWTKTGPLDVAITATRLCDSDISEVLNKYIYTVRLFSSPK